ncbi:MAG TPA: UvrD-helicase domain-containing protein [Limnochordia bacterium]|nr:UvrD-helicase domain-containing protein [Limnochordia bacterium]
MIGLAIGRAEREAEERRLVRVHAEIAAQAADAAQAAEEHKARLRAERRQFAEEGPRFARDFDDALELVETEKQLAGEARTHAFFDRMVRRFDRMAASPYFGRIDFREDGTKVPEAVYIGIFGLTTATGTEHLIYDWRAPISSMFYDSEPGRAGYLCPAGRIEGDLQLKRQYRIVGGRLEWLFDTGLKIDDDVLQEILSKSADEKMQNIVATIQREQNRIIRDEAHRVLIVQGPAGSGKTSIALHRIAYLLYSRRDELTAANIVVMSPNEIFSAYIADVLPELGEENMRQTTFTAYAKTRLGGQIDFEEPADQLEALLTRPCDAGRLHSIRLKNSQAFVAALSGYMERLEAGAGVDFVDVVHQGNVIVSAAELARLFADNRFLPLAGRLEKLKRRGLFLLEPLEATRRREVAAELEAGPDRLDKEDVRRLARQRVERELGPVKAQLAQLAELDAIGLYMDLFRDEDLAAELFGETEAPEGWREAARFTLARYEAGRLGYEDVAPLLYFMDRIEGAPVQNAIRHVVIDEAQDYAPAHFALWRRLYPAAHFTILGDLNQAIHPFWPVAGYEGVAEALGGAELLRLEKSYRSTSEIVAFTKALLPDGEPVEGIERHGERPHVTRVRDEAKRAEAVAQAAEAARVAGAGSVAVICRSAAAARQLHEALPTEASLRLIRKDDRALAAGGVVIPAYLAKGLEFDAVVIADAESYNAPEVRKLLYTACTRALHDLRLVAVGQLGRLFAGVPAEAYVVEELATAPAG